MTTATTAIELKLYERKVTSTTDTVFVSPVLTLANPFVRLLTHSFLRQSCLLVRSLAHKWPSIGWHEVNEETRLQQKYCDSSGFLVFWIWLKFVICLLSEFCTVFLRIWAEDKRLSNINERKKVYWSYAHGRDGGREARTKWENRQK